MSSKDRTMTASVIGEHKTSLGEFKPRAAPRKKAQGRQACSLSSFRCCQTFRRQQLPLGPVLRLGQQRVHFRSGRAFRERTRFLKSFSRERLVGAVERADSRRSYVSENFLHTAHSQPCQILEGTALRSTGRAHRCKSNRGRASRAAYAQTSGLSQKAGTPWWRTVGLGGRQR
jgi:hypothetical protein